MKRRNPLLKTSIFAVGALEVINRIIDSSAIANFSTRTGGKYYHWKHGDIYYRVFGEKNLPPVLLIHDLTVWSSDFEWLKTAKQLSDTYRVYCVDLIGCGKSDKPGITYTNFFYVQMISDFVTNVIGQKTKVAATGLSGSFVIMANALNQQLFEDIILVSPNSLSSLRQTPENRSKVILKLFDIPVIGRTLYYLLTNRSNTEYYLTEQCFFNSFHMEPSIVKAYYDGAHFRNGNGKYLFASLQSNYLYADITKALKSAENRITVAVGAQNPNGLEIAHDYQRVNPHIIIENIEGANMLPHLEGDSYEEMLELMYHF